MTHHEFDSLDRRQRQMFIEAIEHGEPVEQALVRIANETRIEFREIVIQSEHTKELNGLFPTTPQRE